MTLWLIILLAGLVTFGIRLSFIVALGQMNVPEQMKRALRFVPAAVLSAIVLPELLRPGGQLDISPGNARLLAGLLAILVAWRTRNVLLTIAVGMAAVWVLQSLLPH